KGVRMKSDIPKVLHPLCGKSLIEHVVDSLNLAGVDDILVVVGYRGDEVIDRLGNTVNYVWQYEQLGTGHAVMQAEDFFKNYNGDIIVASGDVPLIKPETFKNLIALADEKTGAAVLTMIQDNPTGYGRIVKYNEKFVRIVEEKDADDEIRKIKEVNSGTYIFKSRYLFEGLKRTNTDNAQGEYYLPDVLNYILSVGLNVEILRLIDSIEGSGVNTKEELKSLEQYIAMKEGLN
ncbi:MAG: sugar phosphate nucleotidyltransferase, partial [Leptospirales bacterium]|nr:sugar phosphate nucleotidyltransferase [Leptospirales bacterium]